MEPLEVGDIVTPVRHGEGPDFLGVVTFVMSSSGAVSNPYSIEWNNGGEGFGIEGKDLRLLMRPKKRVRDGSPLHTR